ncbi:MAG: hypothetical protein M1839_009146 [Geoglossum umbratile]|nr:MAG: hypothetical protein M1839_009146 [Geoglossum umbratile]
MSQTQAIHTDSSLTEQDSQGVDKDKKAKTRRPANTAFRQQRLKAWQPILTPKTVLPLFFIVGIIFAPIGGLLLWASSQVQEIVINYSDCETKAPSADNGGRPSVIDAKKVSSSFTHVGNVTIQPAMWKKSVQEVDYYPGVKLNTTICSIIFHLPVDLKPPVLLYYRLTNFYQNHRRYVKSLDSDQLKGAARSASSINTGSCDPLRLGKDGKPYYPCGLIANSIFNDTLGSPVLVTLKSGEQIDGTNNKTYPMSQKGIAWPSDKALYGPTKYKVDEIAVPPNWQTRWPKGYTAENPPPDLEEDEAFQVWMRTAGLPTFSKLARRNDNATMESGFYQIDIGMNFNVTAYGGTKSLVITTTTVMGGKNPFLGIAYVVVGGICVVLGALFTITHLIRPRKLGDHTYLTWGADQPTTAAASGRDIRGISGNA